MILINPEYIILIVEKLNLGFQLPVEVLPSSWKMISNNLNELGRKADLRMAQKKAGPVVTDQGNLVLDVSFENGINNPENLEQTINNLPGVLENGLFVNLTDEVLVGQIVNGTTSVNRLTKT